MEKRGSCEPRHEGGVFDRVPEPPAAPAELVVGPPRTHRDADRQEHPGGEVQGLTQRAQAASIRPSISAAIANEKAIEKPT